MLTKEQLKAREGKLTASRVGVLMSEDEAKILSLWNEMLGLEEPPDLSGVWPVRLGETTEKLQLDWYGEKRNIEVTRRGEVVIHKKFDWAAATLDGFDQEYDCPIEAKHCGGREPLETIIARYTPQCTWQMLVTDTTQCALSIIMGADAPIVEFIRLNPNYAKELMTRATAFMLCVQTLTPPVKLPPVEPPVIPAKEYDMISAFGDAVGVSWKGYADRWLQAQGAALTARECETAIKKIVPPDAKKAFGAGIVVTRNRAGSMALREMK